MAEYVAVATQQVAANGNVIFTNTAQTASSTVRDLA